MEKTSSSYDRMYNLVAIDPNDINTRKRVKPKGCTELVS